MPRPFKDHQGRDLPLGDGFAVVRSWDSFEDLLPTWLTFADLRASNPNVYNSPLSSSAGGYRRLHVGDLTDMEGEVRLSVPVRLDYAMSFTAHVAWGAGLGSGSTATRRGFRFAPLVTKTSGVPNGNPTNGFSVLQEQAETYAKIIDHSTGTVFPLDGSGEAKPVDLKTSRPGSIGVAWFPTDNYVAICQDRSGQLDILTGQTLTGTTINKSTTIQPRLVFAGTPAPSAFAEVWLNRIDFRLAVSG